MDAPTDNTAIGQRPMETSSIAPRPTPTEAPAAVPPVAAPIHDPAPMPQRRAAEPAMAPPPPATTAPADGSAGDGSPGEDGADDAGTGSSRLIRPYAMTGGRTGGHAHISLESQIQTSTRLDDSTKYRWEAAKILKLAERPMALVEIAARAEIPIGVARVVISDLVDAGAVNVQRHAPVTSYTSLLEKVLDGIRDL